ncbi:MAG TPA: hypothetical protein VH253_20390 [Phycisphaerae bacterium]|nr:hypothetical protein [Phycisphaerae bacterium]
MADAPATVQAERLPPFAFPTGLCAGAIACTGVALILASLDVRWGVGASGADGLTRAWRYVNVALGMVWLALWPALAVRERGEGRMVRRDADPGRWRPLLEFLAIAIGALPALGIAAAVGWPAEGRAGWLNVAQTAAVQGAVGLLAAGVLSWRGRPAGRALAGILPALAFALPLAAFVLSQFYPAGDGPWEAFVPLLAMGRAANGEATDVFRWMVLAYAAAGGALWAAGAWGRQRD